MNNYFSYKDSLRAGISSLLLDPRVYLIGEDLIEPYGGAYSITKGMSERFPYKMINTPMSEQAFTGLGVGMALGGYKPIVEITILTSPYSSKVFLLNKQSVAPIK